MSKDAMFGVVRALLAAVGGYFVGKGIVDAETATSVAGAVATLVAAVWSVLTKKPPETVE